MSLETPNVATYAMDAIGFLEPQDGVDKLISEFDSGKGELKAHAMIVRAIARCFSDSQRLALSLASVFAVPLGPWMRMSLIGRFGYSACTKACVVASISSNVPPIRFLVCILAS
jgi:hypothetical protein